MVVPASPSGDNGFSVTYGPCSETCGIVHWPRAHLVVLEATSELYTPSGAPADVTVNKPECSRQPSCVVEC